MHALDFETVSRKHDEFLLLQMVDKWEEYDNIRHNQPMSLEDRWNYFIAATEPRAAAAA